MSAATVALLISLLASPQDPALVEARALVDQGRLDDAERMVRRSIEAQPTADGHFLLGYILFRHIQARAPLEGAGAGHAPSTRERALASLQEYAKGARYGDPGPLDLKTAALAQILLGNYAAADDLLTRSVRKDPKDAHAWYYLGRTKYNENRFQEAIEAFQQCLDLQPRNVKAMDNLGLSYAGLGRVAEALAAHRTSLEWQAGMSSPDPGPFLNLGSLLLEEDQPQEALPHLVRAVALSPSDARVRERLGKAHLQLGDIDRAVAELEAAVRLDPESAPVHFILGQAYRKKGWTEKAKAAFDRVADLNAKRRP